MGFVMLLLSVLTLPALMRFFTWTTGTIASSAGGGQLLGAATVGAIAIGAMRTCGGGSAQEQAAYLDSGSALRRPAAPAEPGRRAAVRAAHARPGWARADSDGRPRAPRRAHSRPPPRHRPPGLPAEAGPARPAPAPGAADPATSGAAGRARPASGSPASAAAPAQPQGRQPQRQPPERRSRRARAAASGAMDAGDQR